MILEGHSNGVLFGLGFLILFDVADYVILPFGGWRMVLVGNLVENIVQVVDGVDDLADVGLL